MGLSEKTTAVLSLRKRFGTVPFEQFREVVDILWEEGIDTVVSVLAEEEAKAVALEAERMKRVEQVLEQIKASEIHRKIHIAVPDGVDLEHAQAILVHGFIVPSSKRSFIGSNKVSMSHVRSNVENKLWKDFSHEKYDVAWRWLVSLGVISTAYSRTSGACSLVLTLPKRSSAESRRLLDAIHRFIKAHE